jgi:hypothetical protein
MSKASEYVKKCQENRRPSFDLGNGWTPMVDNSGGLHLLPRNLISAEKALEFGQWLIDTFGETGEPK